MIRTPLCHDEVIIARSSWRRKVAVLPVHLISQILKIAICIVYIKFIISMHSLDSCVLTYLCIPFWISYFYTFKEHWRHYSDQLFWLYIWSIQCPCISSHKIVSFDAFPKYLRCMYLRSAAFCALSRLTRVAYETVIMTLIVLRFFKRS